MSPFDNLNKIDSFLYNRCTFKGSKLKFKIKIYQMDFWFEFFNIHMNEKTRTCDDCIGNFTYQNINIFSNLIIFHCCLTLFLVHWIIIAPFYFRLFKAKLFN